MLTLDDRIDALYALPLAQFTAARNDLAKSLAGADRVRVRSLGKPATVAWAVNVLYWRERKTFERLRRCGQSLRAAQVAALNGHAADVRTTTAEHREALADAVSCARQLATGAGAMPDADALARMLEALSVSADDPVRPGRWTEALRPAGFEALAGITPAIRPSAPVPARPPETPPATRRRDTVAERRQREADAVRRTAAEAALRKARGDVDRSAAAEASVDAQVESARQQLARAEAARDAARDGTMRAKKALADAEAALARI
jgi:hypothetical protein